jgi:hypothetical protein
MSMDWSCGGCDGVVFGLGVPSMRQYLLGRSGRGCVPDRAKEVVDWSLPAVQHLLPALGILEDHGFVSHHPVF